MNFGVLFYIKKNASVTEAFIIVCCFQRVVCGARMIA